jgi:hypothetical protein
LQYDADLSESPITMVNSARIDARRGTESNHVFAMVIAFMFHCAHAADV